MAYCKEAGIGVRTLFLPAGLQADWNQMVIATIPLLRSQLTDKRQKITIVAESFGACLALRVAKAAPDLIERMVLVNTATCFTESLAGVTALLAGTNLLSLFPARLYRMAQEILLPILMERRNISKARAESMMIGMMAMQPPVGMVPVSGCPGIPSKMLGEDRFHVPARTANFRVNLLQSANLSDAELRSIEVPTLLVASMQDRIFPSVAESTRLQGLLADAKRLTLPRSGHTALLEDGVNLIQMMRESDFLPEFPVEAQEEDLEDEWEEWEEAGPGPSSRAAAVSNELTDIDLAWAENEGLMRALRVLVAPVVYGEEHIPSPTLVGKRPILFVGNHTRFGIYDLPHLLQELYVRGLKVRGLAHSAHWDSPLKAGQLFERFGAVPASPRNAYRLLRNKDAVLLFPGGGREVFKRADESYQLLWGDKPEFVRMAVKLNAIIVPFAAMGGDDAYDNALETEDILAMPVVGDLIKGTIAELVPQLEPEEGMPPLTYFPGTRIPQPYLPMQVPKLERLYFQFCEPIDTAELDTDLKDPEQCQALYERVQHTILASIDELRDVQAADPDRKVSDRLQSAVEKNIVPPITSLFTEP